MMTPHVVVDQNRYDELLHKEALLETIQKLHGRMTDYAFKDAVGFVLKPITVEVAKTDEQV